ncbi:hypothetical protein MTBLM1_90232 [Rhodospirillaceae bacterium LM-1]|nr:hypothetical protein MTBLM1_90232 [Rhodospirillaceae bacterium LM-1]
MLDMNGPDVIRQIKSTQPGIKTVLMSGSPFPEMESGLADACIDKPLDPVELAEILARLLAAEDG